MPPDTLLARALESVDRSAYLARIGFRAGDAGGAAARGSLEHRAHNANRAGAVHGGAIASVLLATAELAAAASERDAAAVLQTSTAAISFLDAVRAGERVDAAARVLRRGRDTIHVGVEAQSYDARPLASALLVYRVTAPGAPPGAIQRSRAASALRSEAGALAGSPYMGACEARILESTGEWSGMSLPLAPNEGARGRVHDGAMIGLVDTCAALATNARTSELARPASATVSLSGAWAGALDGDLLAGAHVLGGAAGTFACECEVFGARDGLVRAAALVCYRVGNSSSPAPVA